MSQQKPLWYEALWVIFLVAMYKVIKANWYRPGVRATVAIPTWFVVFIVTFFPIFMIHESLDPNAVAAGHDHFPSIQIAALLATLVAGLVAFVAVRCSHHYRRLQRDPRIVRGRVINGPGTASSAPRRPGSGPSGSRVPGGA